jgi:hypothetical protein
MVSPVEQINNLETILDMPLFVSSMKRIAGISKLGLKIVAVEIIVVPVPSHTQLISAIRLQYLFQECEQP